MEQDQEQLGLREALKKAAVALKEARVPFALIGSYALWAWGGPEPDHDVDFLVAESDRAEALRALGDDGFRLVQPPEDWLFKAYLDDAMVDIIYRWGGTMADRGTLEPARTLEVASVTMPVLPPTELVIQKLGALGEHNCDFTALLPAMRALREQVDWDQVVRECGANDFASALLFLMRRLRITDPP